MKSIRWRVRVGGLLTSFAYFQFVPHGVSYLLHFMELFGEER